MVKKKVVVEISADLDLPSDAVTQKFAFLARSGAGKTYGASKLAEGLLDAGAQVLVIDPVGVWWGLRLDADGKGPGIQIPVFGGLHGDIPLEPTSGHLVADLAVDRGISAVLDVSMMRKGDRKKFCTDFAEQLFHRKKASRSPIHVVIEEAHVFVPQRALGDEARMLGAFEDICKLGRNFGIGYTLVDQRPQSVNKDVLNQVECLFALQTNGAQERKALRDWIVDQGLDTKLLEELPGLPIGTAFVWSPQWLRILKKVRIAKKRTFNASATPEMGEKAVEPRQLAPVDMEHLREAMASTVAAAEKSDPKVLQRKVAQLERELAQGKVAAPAPEIREVSILKDEDRKLLQEQFTGVRADLDRTAAKLELLADAVRALTPPAPAPRTSERHRQIAAEVNAGTHLVRTGPYQLRAKDSPGESTLQAGPRKMLEALALRHPKRLTRDQLGALTGYPAGKSTFRNHLSTLRTAGLVVEVGTDEVGLSSDGEKEVAAEIASAPRSQDEVLQMWRSRLEAGPLAMFDALVGVYPDFMTRSSLGAMTRYPSDKSTFRNHLSRLRTLGLLEERDDEVKASDALYA